VLVGVAVGEQVMVADIEGVGEIEAVTVKVDVGVSVGVIVKLAASVAVGVLVIVTVEVDVGVSVKVDVATAPCTLGVNRYTDEISTVVRKCVIAIKCLISSSKS